MNKINPEVFMKMKRAKDNQDPPTGEKNMTEITLMDIEIYFKAIIIICGNGKYFRNIKT